MDVLYEYQKNNHYSFTLGMSLTIEALKHRPQTVKEVILSDKVKDNEFLKELERSCFRHQIPLRTDENIIRHLSVKENCFAIAVFDKFSSELKKEENHILLYDFIEEGNLGTTLRSAVSFNFKNIALIANRVDLFNPKTVRASMGAIFHCNIEIFNTIDDYLAKYPNHHLYPLLTKGKECKDVDFISPFAMVLPGRYGELDELFKDGYSFGEHHNLSLPVYTSLSLYQAYLHTK